MGVFPVDGKKKELDSVDRVGLTYKHEDVRSTTVTHTSNGPDSPKTDGNERTGSDVIGPKTIAFDVRYFSSNYGYSTVITTD